MQRSTRHDLEKEVIDGLSQLILFHLNNAAHQQYCPSSDPDQMDAQIEDGQKRAASLRRIRTDFENTATGILDAHKDF